ncbi:MAG: RNA chaperone Hfq [Tissierellia bacterium]|jgi:host factor-I protein|nr:RNA chaperone Hfq [Bacillota bacterium]NLL23552.1 RNA chaperone Hfq [Tissierellia bacterium]
MKQSINYQDNFLNTARKEKITVTIFLISGYQIRGQVKGFDNFTILIDSEGTQQLIYKHAISTLIPSRSLRLQGEEDEL